MLINPEEEFGVLLTACQAASARTGKHEAKANAAQARIGSGSGDGLWVVVFLTEMRGNKREGVGGLESEREGLPVKPDSGLRKPSTSKRPNSRQERAAAVYWMLGLEEAPRRQVAPFIHLNYQHNSS